jgi:hypothetical protein
MRQMRRVILDGRGEPCEIVVDSRIARLGP